MAKWTITYENGVPVELLSDAHRVAVVGPKDIPEVLALARADALREVAASIRATRDGASEYWARFVEHLAASPPTTPPSPSTKDQKAHDPDDGLPVNSRGVGLEG